MRTPKLEFPARLSRSGGESLYPDTRQYHMSLTKSLVSRRGSSIL